jgi:hypothetical protein
MPRFARPSVVLPRSTPATASPASCASTTVPLTPASPLSSSPCMPSCLSSASTSPSTARPSALRQRAAVRVQGREVAGAVLRPGRVVGGTVRLSRPARAEGSTATRSTPVSAPLPTFRWHGKRTRPETPRFPSYLSLLDKIADYGIAPTVCIADEGYDAGSFYEVWEARNVRPVAPLRQTGKVVAGDHLPPSCDHGRWTFAGADAKRGGRSTAAYGRVLPGQRVGQSRGSTPSSRRRRLAGRLSTAAVVPWSGSSVARSTNGCCCRFGYGGSSGWRCTLPDDPLSARRGARQGPSRPARGVAPLVPNRSTADGETRPSALRRVLAECVRSDRAVFTPSSART